MPIERQKRDVSFQSSQFSVIPVFSRAAARFGQDIGNTSGLFLILRGFAPLREIHGGGYAAQVGRFGETALPVFYSGADCALQVRCDTKNRLLLDFSRGEQRVSPVCCGLMGRVRESRPVFTRPRRPCPPFPLQSPISKGQWY